MPALNAADFLPATLKSIWAQSYHDFELLVVDDGSTDNTPRILNDCKDPRLRILRNETRRKLAGALNRGLHEARGELIARMDADDMMYPKRLEYQVSFMDRHPHVGLCGGQVRAFDGNPNPKMSFPRRYEDIKAFALFYAPFAHPTVMFRREWFVKQRLTYRPEFYPTEDYELWSRAIRCFPCANLLKSLIRYRIHDKSMTGAEWSDMDSQTSRVQETMLRQLGISPSEEELHLHRAASMGGLPADSESFGKAEMWLQKIKEANQKALVFEGKALANMLNYIWFRVAMAAVKEMGTDAWLLFRRSGLSRIGCRALKHRYIVRLSSLKIGLTGVGI